MDAEFWYCDEEQLVSSVLSRSLPLPAYAAPGSLSVVCCDSAASDDDPGNKSCAALGSTWDRGLQLAARTAAFVFAQSSFVFVDAFR